MTLGLIPKSHFLTAATDPNVTFGQCHLTSDVTLVTDDQKLVTAHKLVLSTSSEYFKNIFKNNKISNPFLCLDGISSTDLNNILDYIYNKVFQVLTKCQGHHCTGNNQVPSIKTSSSVLEVVKLMPWRQATSPLKFPS